MTPGREEQIEHVLRSRTLAHARLLWATVATMSLHKFQERNWRLDMSNMLDGRNRIE